MTRKILASLALVVGLTAVGCHSDQLSSAQPFRAMGRQVTHVGEQVAHVIRKEASPCKS